MDFRSAIPSRHYRIASRFLLVLVAALLITWLVPKRIQFKYEFELGKPWKYENLLAPFDFGVLKSAEEVEVERAAVAEQFAPYYEVDPGIADRAKSQFTDAYALRIPILKLQVADSTRPWTNRDSIRHLEAGLDALDAVYARGILLLDTAHRTLPPDARLYILRGVEAEETTKKSLLSLADASRVLAAELEQIPDIRETFVYQLAVAELQPDVSYNRSLSEKALAQAIDEIAVKRGKVNRGEKIIYTGEIVDSQRYMVLNSLRQEFTRSATSYKSAVLWFGYFLVIALALYLYTVFLMLFARPVFKNARNLAFSLLLIISFVVVVIVGEMKDMPTMFILPLCVIPIVQRNFFGTWAALITHVTAVLICSFLVPNGADFIFLHLSAGLVAIYANLKAQYWSQFFVAVALILATYWIAYLGIAMMQEGSLDSIEWPNFGWLALNAFFTLMAYPLTLVFERFFGIVSDITLRELADLNKPLLRELSIKAQGTFQHSLQVANLAEAAASQIGANALVTRVGCLYHDIGKMRHPSFFTENQASDFTPHDKLNPQESAEVIIGHVAHGVEIARAHHLPEVLVDFIRTHHGTTRVEFFFRKHLDAHPGRDEAEEAAAFTYPGPAPFSRETGIVMLADSVEAASRSLKEPSVADMDQLVDGIVQYKIDAGQLDGADLTFKDIGSIKRIFKTMLKSIYHVRPKYPEKVQPVSAK